jgi:hypothetical protein
MYSINIFVHSDDPHCDGLFANPCCEPVLIQFRHLQTHFKFIRKITVIDCNTKKHEKNAIGTNVKCAVRVLSRAFAE